MIWLIVGAVILGFGFMVFFGAPYVPSQGKYIRRAFDHFGLNDEDVLIDVGSGDGIVLRNAARYGARAIGYEINPALAALSRLLSFGNKRISVSLANFWHVTLPADTTIVYAFSVSRDEAKLTKLLQRETDRLGRPLKLLCYGSPIKSRQPDELFEAYHLYIFQPLQPKKA